MILFSWILFILCLSYPADGLLNTISASDKIIMELQRNMTKLQQQMGKTTLDQNRTIMELEQKLKVTAIEMNNTVEIINSLSVKVKEQNTTISKLSALVMDQNRTIRHFEQENNNQHIAEIDNRMNETFNAYELLLRDVVDRQKHHVNKTYSQTRALDQRVSDLGKQFHYLSLSILDAEKKTSLLNTSLQESEKNIAFTVSLSSEGSQWANKKIVYDRILLNIGNGYSAQNGVFTCPRDGEYVFTWSTMSRYDNEGCYADIHRNGVAGLRTYSHEAGGSYNEVASNTALFHLTKGDSVWIQTGTCGYFFGYPYTAFSGWRL